MGDLLTVTGPALDAEICRVVFGLKVESVALISGDLAYGVWGQNPRRPAEVSAPRPYSSDIGDAWRVVERMQELGWWARLTTPFEPGQPWFCGFTPLGMSGWNGRPDHKAGAETMPLAICRVALKALASDGVPTTKWGD